MNEEDFIFTLFHIGLWEEIDTYTNIEKVEHIQELLLHEGIISIAVGRVSGRKRVIVVAVPVDYVPRAKEIAGVRERGGRDGLGAYSWYDD